jgi:hypothetical protein
MKLMTKALEKQFAKTGNQEHEKNPLVIAKFFLPAGGATWYATEWDPETNHIFGFVTGLDHDEWGYTDLTELAQVRGPFGLGIERDLYFDPKPADQIPAIKLYQKELGPEGNPNPPYEPDALYDDPETRLY